MALIILPPPGPRPATDNAAMPLTLPQPTALLSPRLKGLLAAVITVIVWTGFILAGRASSDPTHGGTLTPLDLIFCRLLGAGLVLLPWGWWLVRSDRARGEGQASLLGLSPLPLRLTATLGLFGSVLYALLAYNAFALAPATHASVLMPGSLPLWTTLLAAVIMGDRITPLRALGLACIVLGDLLVGGASLLRAFQGGEVWKGDLMFMMAAMCWGTYSVLARHYRLDAVRATVAVTAFGCFTWLPIYAVLLLSHAVTGHVLEASWREIVFQMLLQGGWSVVISGIAFTKMLQYYGAVRSTMITALVPGLSAMGAVLLLGEPLYWNLGAGLMMVTLGILFGVRATVVVKP